ncbi:MAG TPA: response regulator [Oligoflexus sp.]|uniref:response regulator n=1 Tax=Oligoflexus sp. TaxID=1971216 RepID=UPI002D80FD81|nr:response regulator [Oligoflexus sp.]HET9240061.1 response regulator [Oligoflexus sp.]
MHNNPTRKKIRFLLVEDDLDHAAILTRAMKGQPFDCELHHVENGVDALAYLRHEPPFQASADPDVVLLDLKLPKLSGHEVLSEIRKDPELADIPVIILSTSNAESDIKNVYQNHANSYLVKPLDFQSFRKMAEDLQEYWGQWNNVPRRSTPRYKGG